MRVTFPRLPDHERAYALVERDDGAVYRLYGGQAGPRLPHDIMHFVVERELRIGDGIWGGIAAGIIFDTMQHVSGRRRRGRAGPAGRGGPLGPAPGGGRDQLRLAPRGARRAAQKGPGA
jgi:hypothetical protein